MTCRAAITLFIISVVSPCLAISRQRAKIKIACIGASITYGSRLKNPVKDSYPGQLQTRLGNTYEVKNFGVAGCTMLNRGDKPYRDTREYREALAYLPDIVTIDLGGNDSKAINRVHLNDYKSDCMEIVASFANLPSHPRIILMTPVVSFVADTSGIWDPVIVKNIIPRLREVAFEHRLELFDPHPLMTGKPALMPDRIHPDSLGSSFIAKGLFDLIHTKRDTAYNIFEQLPSGKIISSFYGYACADFTFNGRSCKVVQPKHPAVHHPWIWRARFWGHEPQTDIALLERGFHVVYCDVAELLGNNECTGIWDHFYELMHSAGLAKKAALEGMSRGGIYVFNWAAVNPKKVACIYADNPLLNLNVYANQMLPIKGKNDLTAMFEAFKKDYGLVSDEAVKNFKQGPIESIHEIVKGHYPILIVCADADEMVSPAENTYLFEEKINKLHGNIRVIHKPGFKHHPHSLPDPTPIVDFVVNAQNKVF